MFPFFTVIVFVNDFTGVPVESMTSLKHVLQERFYSHFLLLYASCTLILSQQCTFQFLQYTASHSHCS